MRVLTLLLLAELAACGNDIEVDDDEDAAVAIDFDELPMDGGIGYGSLGDAACATAQGEAGRLPAALIIMFDKSNSMNSTKKYPAAAKGLKAFLSDPTTSGLEASLEFFCGGGECDQRAADYAVPTVPLTALPNLAAFESQIDNVDFCSGTPINPALRGAYAYAATQMKPGRVNAAVLVTDAQPVGCGNVNTCIALATAELPDLKTYVIGVGNSLDNLKAIAAAGGTTAIIINPQTPDQVTKDFLAALDQIKHGLTSCNFSLPSPPQGQVLDPFKINVLLKQNGVENPIYQDQDCSSGSGWQYDNESSPTQVKLCPTTCDLVKTDPTLGVNILFGCATIVP